MKFVNPGKQHVRVAMITGHIADFPPGEVIEVPDLMRSECLSRNLTEVDGDETEVVAPVKPVKQAKQTKQTKAAAAPAAVDGESTDINVSDAE